MFFLLSLASFAQQKLPNTLLWRISGNGLQKPSYLWGTLHLQDKRLFQFGDSLYRALETTDGYAMELNPQELVDSLFHNGLRQEEDEMLARQKVVLNRKTLSKGADSLLRSAGINGDVATKKQLKKLRDRRMAKYLQQGEMPTIMDAYLYGLAQRLNKWTGGIEDVADQLNIADELGGPLQPEAVLMPETVMNNTMERMTQIYLSQDLNRIDSFSNGAYNARDKDAILLHRNAKMALRMDSLAHRRPTFFTVGAAHLPGDSGVIALLKSRGFAVQPVFSSSTRFSGDYAAGLPPLKWDTIEGTNKAYTVNMPVRPSDYNFLGNLFKMKACFDMTTMTFYLAGAISDAKVGSAMLDGMLKGAAENMTGRPGALKTKVVQSGGLSGKEAVVENAEGIYRMRLLLKNKTVFMLMAGVLKKSNINSPDVERFFASFVPGETMVKAAAWQRFSLPEKNLSVNFPGKPERAEAIDKSLAQNSNWRSVSYNAVDAEKGFYYLLQVRETAEGYTIEGDSALLQTLKDDYKERVGDVLSATFGTYEGYPALFMDGYEKKADAVYKILHVIRANRVYTLLAGLPKNADTTDAVRFLHSLTLLPYEAVAVKTESIDGFSTTLPAVIKRTPPDTAEKHPFYQSTYLSTNANDAVIYQVFKQGFSPTWWAKNDSSFFETKLEQYRHYKDSVIKKERVQNGAVKGLEAVVATPGWNGVKRFRFLVNGDTLYTLYSVIPKQDTGGKTHNAFFNDFRVADEVPPTIYTPKAAALFAALQTGDSATYADAAGNLSLVEFTKSDLPLLHAALLLPEKGPESYSSVGDKLASVIGGFADGSTTAFIEKNYASLTGDKAALQYNLLKTLAYTRTAASYALLKKLSLNHPPTSGEAANLRYALLDSLPLTATLFPELLQKSNDSLLGYTAITVANRLLDSNLLSQNVLLPFETVIVEGAKKAEQKLRNGDDGWTFTGWSEMLGYLHSAAGNAVLRKALSAKDPYIKSAVILALLKNKQTVAAEAITKVAADKGQRGDFYTALRKMGREALFPALYASQRSLAESELYNILSEDYDASLTYLGEKTETFNGKKSRFYLFKIRMAYGEADRKQTFLAVAGPYDENAKEKLTTSDAAGFYSGEELTATNLNKLFKLYLQQQGPAEKERE